MISNVAQWLQARERWVSAALVVLVFLVGTLYALRLGDVLRYPDERDYVAIATNLVSSGRFSIDGATPTAFRAPGYPLALAVIAALHPSVFLMRLLNMAALALALVLLGRIVRRHAGSTAALIATVLAAAYPVLMYTAGTLYPQILAGCLLLAVIDAVSVPQPSAWRYVWAGMLMGWLVLTVPTNFVVAGVIVGWIWAGRRRTRRRDLALFTLITTLVIVPWTARNYVQFNTFVFVASNSGLNLLLGNSENTTPNGGVNVDIARYERAASSLDEIERDTYYRDTALRFMRDHKVRTMTLYFQKLLNHFNYRNELWVRTEASRLQDLVMLLSYGPLVCVALVRIALLRIYRPHKIELLFLILYLIHGISTALFFTRIRFRVPFDLLLIGIVAIFAPMLMQMAHRRRKSTYEP